jgi:hypothetical protein
MQYTNHEPKLICITARRRRSFPLVYTAVIILAVLVAGKLLYDAAWFQRAFFPAAYWATQVERIEQDIRDGQESISELRLAHAPDEQDVDESRHLLAIEEELLKENVQDLDYARSQYQRYR